MKVRLLTMTEKTQFGADMAVLLDFKDVAALGANANNAAGPLNVLPGGDKTLPVGTKVRLVAMRLVTPFDFSDAAINSLTLKVGDGGDDDRLLAATQLAADGASVPYASGVIATSPYVFTAADTVDAVFTAAGGGDPTLGECTAGQVVLYFAQEQLSELPIPG